MTQPVASPSELTWTQSRTGLDLQSGAGFVLRAGITGLRVGRSLLRATVTASRTPAARHELHVTQRSRNVIEFWQTFHNDTSQPIRIRAIEMFTGQLQLAGSGWQVAHRELFNVEKYFGGYTSNTGGLFAPVPGLNAELGASENTPFPGLIFTHPERGSILMGTLSQEYSKPHWTLKSQGSRTHLLAEDRFTGIPEIVILPGKTWQSERWVLLAVAGGFDDVIDAYYRTLRKHITFIGETSVLRDAVLWGTWNFNTRPRSFGDIDHAWIAANAKALRKLAPTRPRFVMIDDGYQLGCSEKITDQNWFASCLEFFHHEKLGKPVHDPALFPKGMKGIATEIARTGASPAIWTTPRILAQSALAQKHPDWLLKTADGRPFGVRSAFLDYSIPQVRDYTRSAWDTIINQWGFKGIKLDFWTFPFEIENVRFTHQDRTAIQIRNQFLRDLREFIPRDGYVISCVVVNGGNPFLGQYVDGSRLGADIGAGTWHHLQQSAQTITGSGAFYRHDALLADADTIAWNPDNSPQENRLWATMSLLSGGLCEIGGDLTTLGPDGRDLLTRSIQLFGPARHTRFPVAQTGLGRLPADHLILQQNTRVLEAHLNWHDQPRLVRLPAPVRDWWTDQRISAGLHAIPPHGVLLFER